MTRLDLLDPTVPEDPRFDPEGAQAQRVKAAAVVRPEPRPRKRRRLALAAGAAAALAAAAAIVSTTGSPSDARAVLRDAVERTAAIDSGRIAYTVRANVPAKRIRSTYRQVVRFDGDDLESSFRGRDVEKGRTSVTGATWIVVDGASYSRDDTRRDARFVRDPFGISATDPTRLLVEQVGSPALVELARRSDDLTTAEDPGGGVTYRATTTAGAVFDAAPRAAGRAKGPGWARPVRLEISVDRDGLIRRVRTSSDVETTVTEYRDLGEPQRIERPRTAAESDGEPPPELQDR